MKSIIDSTQCLINQVVDLVKKEVLTAIEPCDHKDTLAGVFSAVPDPFLGVETEALHSRYIKENLNYVEYTEVSLGKILVRKRKGCKRLISEKDESFIYIPILESIRQLLHNSRISSMILRKPDLCESGVFYDIHNGQLYENDNYFKDHEDALALLIYHDELEVCNPLGCNAGTHKVDMFYYTLANINPKFRSKHCAVRLLAIANAKLVKKYGIDSILRPIIIDLHKLYNGHIVEVNGCNKEIFGKVIMCTGDTLGQHYWGGFKEGVGVAFQKCRHCHCEFNKMQNNFVEESFILRTALEYDEQCAAIEQAPNDNVRKDLQTTYGINRKSSLCELPTFDVTKQLPQDIMHTLLEGSVQYEVRLVLLHFIRNGELKLEQINGAIASHNYGYTEISDKPGPLRDSVFFGEERYKLKYKAAQARLFLRLLPFIIGQLVDREDPYYIFLIELIQIVQLIFAPVINKESIQYLRQIIFEHLTNFKTLFPDKNIIPKQHYLIHIPSSIELMGPMVRSSCFSFESAHSYFKELARKQNFKNLPKSLAKRHQFYECSNFGDSNENPSSHPLFSTEKSFGVLKNIDPVHVDNLRQKFTYSGLLPGIALTNIFKVSWIVCHGTKYSKTGVIAVDVNGDPPLPVFGVISQIWLYCYYIYFEVNLLVTDYFDYNHQAYLVRESHCDESIIYSYDGLVDFNVFHIKKDESESYLPVKYDLDDIIEEHFKGTNPLHL